MFQRKTIEVFCVCGKKLLKIVPPPLFPGLRANGEDLDSDLVREFSAVPKTTLEQMVFQGLHT